ATLLNDRFKLLMRGRRTASPRHQTLEATLDWSYDILTDEEKAVLRRLAVFPSRFSFESASACASGPDGAPEHVIDALATLVSKSLVIADIAAAEARYRLLGTTRAYILKKLAESGEANPTFRRHAEHCRTLADYAGSGRKEQPAHEWLAALSDQIDDMRS